MEWTAWACMHVHANDGIFVKIAMKLYTRVGIGTARRNSKVFPFLSSLLTQLAFINSCHSFSFTCCECEYCIDLCGND